jgi:hypothetical protein
VYARFAPKVSTPQFEAEIGSIAENANRHAQWVLDCLKECERNTSTGITVQNQVRALTTLPRRMMSAIAIFRQLKLFSGGQREG